MAEIKALQAQSPEEVWRLLVEKLQQMEPGNLVAQDIMLRGAIHALTTLIGHGCKPEVADSMLSDTMRTLGATVGVADARGIKLMDFSRPSVGLH